MFFIFAACIPGPEEPKQGSLNEIMTILVRIYLEQTLHHFPKTANILKDFILGHLEIALWIMRKQELAALIHRMSITRFE